MAFVRLKPRLDSYLYRVYYNLFNCLPAKLRRNKSLSFPVILKESRLNTPPPQELFDNLSEIDQLKLKTVLEEVDLISRWHKSFPSTITSHQWQELLKQESRKHRLDYLKFLRINEKNAEKEAARKVEKRKNAVEDAETKRSDFRELWIDVHPELLERWKIQSRGNDFVRTLRLREMPTIAVDCRFLPYLTNRAQALTSVQFAYLMAENKRVSSPWPLYLVNFDFDVPAFKTAIKKHLGSLSSSRSLYGIATPDNYTSLFAPKDIIYLSPDAEEALESVEADKCYVIGGIVDRVAEKGIPQFASLEASQADGVTARRLPLDEFVDWKSGNKFLTLVTVMKMLRSNFEANGDWKTAIEDNVPVRYVRAPDEKNSMARKLHERFREHDHAVLQILDEKLGPEKAQNIRQRYIPRRELA